MTKNRIKKYWYVEGVRFRSINDFIGLVKHSKKFNLDKYLNEVESSPNVKDFTPSETMRKLWNEIPKMTIKEAKKKFPDNSERLTIALFLIKNKDQKEYIEKAKYC